MAHVTLKPSTGEDMVVVLNGIHRVSIPKGGIDGEKSKMRARFGAQIENGNLVEIDHAKLERSATGPVQDSIVDPIDATAPIVGPSMAGAAYGCPYCGKGYAQMANLEAHVRAKHPGYPIPVLPPEEEGESNEE